MFWLFTLVFLLTPLVGIALMELGAEGLDVGLGGPNGATLAYAAHLAVVFMTCAALGPRRHKSHRHPSHIVIPSSVDGFMEPWAFVRLTLCVIAVQMLVLLFYLFGLGAIQVLNLSLNRGEFRSEFGGGSSSRFGMLAYFLRDYVAPLTATMVATAYRFSRSRSRSSLALLITTLLLSACTAFVWGYRSSFVFSLIPPLIILIPRFSLRTALAVGTIAFLLTTASQMFFYRRSWTESAEDMAIRLTVGNGNVAWKIWDLYRDGEVFPSYWPTLASLLGDNLSSLFGLPGRGESAWYQHNFSALVTWVAQDYAGGLDAVVSNVSGTSFSAGVIAFGSPFFLVFSVLTGAIIIFFKNRIDSAVKDRRLIASALWASLYAISGLSFINSGDLATLLGIWMFVYATLSVFVGSAIFRISGPHDLGLRPHRPESDPQVAESGPLSLRRLHRRSPAPLASPRGQELHPRP